MGQRVMGQRVMGLAGWSGSGKTTLLTRLIPVLVGQGLRVSTLKHAHHAFDIDRPGKDSFAHRSAGASEVLVASGSRWALMHELRGDAEPSLAAHLARLEAVDLVLVEGWKREAHPKLEVHRAANGRDWLHPEDPAVVGIAADRAPPSGRLPWFGLDDIEAIARFVLEAARPLPAV